jgi:hypothetical protein
MKKRRKAARLEVINACLLAAEAIVSAKLARLPRELRGEGARASYVISTSAG